MATARAILDSASREIGTSEWPPGSNRTKYGEAYGWNGVAWCAIFIWWIFQQNGMALPIKTASCGQLMNAAKSAGLWVTKNYKPGDVVIFDFPGGAATDHVGIVESVNGDTVMSIEGNTGIGNDANGGQVMRRARKTSLIRGALRPKYDPDPLESIYITAQNVVNGVYGTGERRRGILEAEGWDYASVQKIVNALCRGGLSVQVTVSAGSTLSVRAKADVGSKKVSAFQNGTVVKVTEVSAGPGASAWGRTKTGWISMDYVKAV